MVIDIAKLENIFRSRKPGIVGNYRYFSVLFPLVEKAGKLHVLFEVRAQHLKTQPGEVCFPGGKLEGEETPAQCAIRETCEELGIEEDDIKLIARLDTLVQYGDLTIYSYLGVIQESALENMKLNECEVEEIFLVPLSWFFKNEPLVHDIAVKPEISKFPHEDVGVGDDYKWRCGSIDIPIYHWEGYHIWGLTARMVRNFVRIAKNKIGEE
ncbi:MAG: CoA pyrophosphatase [Eubacteriales bacterium]|nr:CoA pyrophosphatase [Eubacteriales bacterium]MDD4389819.1 CoA pyrophosphatase [Eubacteriales bacterium]